MNTITIRRLVGRRTTKKGKLDPARWGWKAVSFFDDYAKLICIPGLPKRGMFQKHLWKGQKCRRCGFARIR